MENWKKELTIGSLVQLKKNDQVIKVELLTKKKVGYHLEPNEDSMHYARLSEIRPIGLTRKILLKNGFRDVEDEKFKREDIEYAMTHDCVYKMVLVKGVNGLPAVYEYDSCRFVYEMWNVHNLQLYFKLLKNYDFADQITV